MGDGYHMRRFGTAALGTVAFVVFGVLFSILFSGRVQWVGIATGAVVFFVVWLSLASRKRANPGQQN